MGRPTAYALVTSAFKRQRAYPDIRAARPRRAAYWIARFIPVVEVWAREVHIGFWHNPDNRWWAPTVARPYIAVNRFGVTVRR